MNPEHFGRDAREVFGRTRIPGLTPRGYWRLGYDSQRSGASPSVPAWWTDSALAQYNAGWQAARNGERRK